MRRSRSLLRGPFGWALTIVLFAGAAWLAVQTDPGGGAVAGRARAVDGDTLRMGSERIRLLGIDAPELGQDCTDANGRTWACGKRARDRLAALIAGQDVTCAADGHDKYGRVLAACTVKGRDLAAAMVTEGLAVGDDGYLLEQSKARLAGAGIWAGTFVQPRAWRDRHRHAEGDDGLLDWLRTLLGQ